MANQYGDTVFISDFQANSSAQKLTRLHFNKSEQSISYDEKWLQVLIDRQPGLLPLTQIGEARFSSMVSVCTELRMNAGRMDNLFVTPEGEIAVVECKLWRNPEARRKVVGQILDYASEMTTWSYAKFDDQIKAAQGASPRSLFEIVSTAGEIDEVTFHDAVSHNLSCGRFLLLIVGDGIREGVETIAQFMSKYASLHFRLSIIELALFELPNGGFIAQPRVLAKTTEIGRMIVELRNSKMVATLASEGSQSSVPRAATITEEQFLADLNRDSPGLPETLLQFLGKLSDLHVKPDFGQKALTLRWHSENAGDWNLATISNSGDVWMEYHAIQARNANLSQESKQYLQSLANLLPGASVVPTKSGNCLNVAGPNSRAPKLADLLVNDERTEGWIQAISRFQSEVSKSSEE